MIWREVRRFVALWAGHKINAFEFAFPFAQIIEHWESGFTA
jgi:hypothetical protein